MLKNPFFLTLPFTRPANLCLPEPSLHMMIPTYQLTTDEQDRLITISPELKRLVMDIRLLKVQQRDTSNAIKHLKPNSSVEVVVYFRNMLIDICNKIAFFENMKQCFINNLACMNIEARGCDQAVTISPLVSPVFYGEGTMNVDFKNNIHHTDTIPSPANSDSLCYTHHSDNTLRSPETSINYNNNNTHHFDPTFNSPPANIDFLNNIHRAGKTLHSPVSSDCKDNSLIRNTHFDFNNNFSHNTRQSDTRYMSPTYIECLSHTHHSDKLHSPTNIDDNNNPVSKATFNTTQALNADYNNNSLHTAPSSGAILNTSLSPNADYNNNNSLRHSRTENIPQKTLADLDRLVDDYCAEKLDLIVLPPTEEPLTPLACFTGNEDKKCLARRNSTGKSRPRAILKKPAKSQVAYFERGLAPAASTKTIGKIYRDVEIKDHRSRDKKRALSIDAVDVELEVPTKTPKVESSISEPDQCILMNDVKVDMSNIHIFPLSESQNHSSTFIEKLNLLTEAEEIIGKNKHDRISPTTTGASQQNHHLESKTPDISSPSPRRYMARRTPRNIVKEEEITSNNAPADSVQDEISGTTDELLNPLKMTSLLNGSTSGVQLQDIKREVVSPVKIAARVKDSAMSDAGANTSDGHDVIKQEVLRPDENITSRENDTTTIEHQQTRVKEEVSSPVKIPSAENEIYSNVGEFDRAPLAENSDSSMDENQEKEEEDEAKRVKHERRILNENDRLNRANIIIQKKVKDMLFKRTKEKLAEVEKHWKHQLRSPTKDIPKSDATEFIPLGRNTGRAAVNKRYVKPRVNKEQPSLIPTTTKGTPQEKLAVVKQRVLSGIGRAAKKQRGRPKVNEVEHQPQVRTPKKESIMTLDKESIKTLKKQSKVTPELTKPKREKSTMKKPQTLNRQQQKMQVHEWMKHNQSHNNNNNDNNVVDMRRPSLDTRGRSIVAQKKQQTLKHESSRAQTVVARPLW